MGCMVNGPGEAREADIAIAGGKGKAALADIEKLIKQGDAAGINDKLVSIKDFRDSMFR